MPRGAAPCLAFIAGIAVTWAPDVAGSIGIIGHDGVHGFFRVALIVSAVAFVLVVPVCGLAARSRERGVNPRLAEVFWTLAGNATAFGFGILTALVIGLRVEGGD